MAGRGGAIPGAGRKKGIPNKSNADLKALLDKHVDFGAKIRELDRLAKEAQSEQTRVMAIGQLFDRRFGKATQPLAGDSASDPIRVEVTDDLTRARALAVFIARTRLDAK